MLSQLEAEAVPDLPASESELAAAIAHGALGWTVRCTPRRRTVVAELGGGNVWFGKLRRGHLAAARAEWRWLHVLPLAGFRVPRPVAFHRFDGHTLLCTEAVAGRPLDVLWLEAAQRGELAPALAFAAEVVAPLVRRLHDRGLVFRDLYWNHLYAETMQPGAAEPVLLDVERVLAPRWRFERWRVKDLAGLLSSLPVTLRAVDLLRLLRAYQGGLQPDWAALALRVVAKARKIRAHRPRYG